jgi:hypothetical protein
VRFLSCWESRWEMFDLAGGGKGEYVRALKGLFLVD